MTNSHNNGTTNSSSENESDNEVNTTDNMDELHKKAHSREGTPLLDRNDESVNNEQEVSTDGSINRTDDEQGVIPEYVGATSSKGNKFAKLSTVANITNWWKSYVTDKKSKRKKLEHTEELRMRYKLQYHFMSPFQKYKLGRKPWKLAIQILKIFIVTTQVILFGTDRFAAIGFMKNTEKTFKNLFIQSYDGSKDFSYYSRTDLANSIRYAHTEYHNIGSIAIGKYWHSRFENDTVKPIKFCQERYVKTKKDSKAINIDYSADTAIVCENLAADTNLSDITNLKHYFDRIVSIKILFEIQAIYLNGMKLHHAPECLIMNNTITIDNSKHDGRLRVSFYMDETILPKCSKNYKVSKDAEIIKIVFISFDALVIAICFFSVVLCIRSVIKSVILAKAAQKYFKSYKHDALTRWDLFELINKWFAVIVISDLLSIIGSIYKIYVDDKDTRYYNICSVFLGLGVVMVWIGLLRFFTYLKKYNILLITLRSAAPSMMRFMFCAMFMFFGFTFCGWIVLGPYHKKFTTFLQTAECLFSLLNGDDMYPTFGEMSKRSTAIWIFSKIYLYTFVSLFIYVVLSTFISIIGDTYERLKDWGHMPPTRIEMFMAGKEFPIGKHKKRKTKKGSYCQRCARENQRSNSFTSNTQSTYGAINPSREESFTSSQISVVSASLE